MIEIIGDIFQQTNADAICFTSNGVVNSKGELVMGAGIAKQFRDRFPKLAHSAGQQVKQFGNSVAIVGVKMKDGSDFIRGRSDANLKTHILNFPTKKHWKDSSSLMLIRKSAKELLEITNKQGWKKVCLSRPGCGLGGLNWEKQVKPLIKDLFDDRFVICHWVEVVKVR